MKKRIFVIIICILSLITFILYNLFTRSVNANINVDDYDLYIKKTSTIINGPKLYYTDGERNIYLVGLRAVDLKNGNKSITLKDYLKDKDIDIIFNNILYSLNKIGSLWDGGTSIYRNKKNDLTIIMCNTIDGNRDIYIGTGKMEKENSFCSRKVDNNNLNKEIANSFSSTEKIIIQDSLNNIVIKEITKEKDINKIIDILTTSKEAEKTTTSEASNWYMEFLDSDDNLVSRIWLWKSGYFGYNDTKEYSLTNIDDLKNIIER